MDDIILAALQDRISAADQARLDMYRSASPVNEDRYQELAALWNACSRSDPFTVEDSVPPDELVRLMRSPMEEREASVARIPSPAPAESSGRRMRVLVPAFAAAAGIAATVLFMTLGKGPDKSVAPALSASEFVTDTSETATARLEDGSVVRLAPKSRLRVAPTSGRREVWLDGGGFFAVAHDSSRPFTVRTRIGSIDVLGTRFDARVEGSTLRIIVTEGTVALTAGDSRVLVPKGHMATATETGPPVVVAVKDQNALLSWMHDALIFQNTPLSDVARELEQRYKIRVLLPDSAVASRRVTAWFINQEAKQVLEAVCRAVEAHCSLVNGVASMEP